MGTDSQFNTGIIEDKQTRALLHFAIRIAFPVLLTVTYSNQKVRKYVSKGVGGGACEFTL